MSESRHSGTVLTVDDDIEWLDFLAGVLRSDYRVLSATNGEDAVATALRERPDVIVLDVMMQGGKDGFATFAELQRDPKTQGIPVLMLTAVNQKTDLLFGAKDMGQYLGGTPAAFLEKPISAERLLKEVRKALDARSSDQEGARPKKH